MSTEACNACGALCDEEQFNREGMGYCAQCFAESGPAGAIAVIAESVSLLRAVDSSEGSFMDRKADALERVGANVVELEAAARELDEELDGPAIAHRLRAALARMGSGADNDDWIPFAERWPNCSVALDDPSVSTVDAVLVTNHLHARDRMGRMSHVWLASPIQSSNGKIVAFTEAHREIFGLTHWKDVGLSAKGGAA